MAIRKKRKAKKKSNPRIPRKKGQRRNSKKHSDLYTDENPKRTIKGLGFATVLYLILFNLVNKKYQIAPQNQMLKLSQWKKIGQK